MEVPALDQQTWLIIGIVTAAVVVALIVLGIVLAARKRKEQDRLRERFGPEYEHAVEAEGSRKATDDLHGREADREGFSPADPGEETRAELRGRMAELQYRFSEEPADVLLETQRVVIDALRACGYPVAEDRERSLRLLSVDHPDVVGSLRTLLDGSYGQDVGRMRTLFVDTKRALRDVARVSYGPHDLTGHAGGDGDAASGQQAQTPTGTASARPTKRSPAERSGAPAGEPDDAPRPRTGEPAAGTDGAPRAGTVPSPPPQ